MTAADHSVHPTLAGRPTDRSAEREEPAERPAVVANAVAGLATEALGHIVGDERLIDEGQLQADVAGEVYRETTS